MLRRIVSACLLMMFGGIAVSHPQQARTSTLSYPEFEKNPNVAIGKPVAWTGQLMEYQVTTTKEGKSIVKETYFLVPKPARAEDWKWFVADLTDAQISDEAKRLDGTPKDPGIRLIKGTISGLAEIGVRIGQTRKNIRVPVVSKVTKESPPSSATQ